MNSRAEIIAYRIVSVLFICLLLAIAIYFVYQRNAAPSVSQSQERTFRLVQISPRDIHQIGQQFEANVAGTEAYDVHIYRNGTEEEIIQLWFDPRDYTGNLYIPDEPGSRTVHAQRPEECVNLYIFGKTTPEHMPRPGEKVDMVQPDGSIKKESLPPEYYNGGLR